MESDYQSGRLNTLISISFNAIPKKTKAHFFVEIYQLTYELILKFIYPCKGSIYLRLFWSGKRKLEVAQYQMNQQWLRECCVGARTDIQLAEINRKHTDPYLAPDWWQSATPALKWGKVVFSIVLDHSFEIHMKKYESSLPLYKSFRKTV